MSLLRIVTTSWDDGDPADLKLAGLLRSRGLPGTFYVPLTGYRGRPTVGAADLRSLASEGFEIGGHGVSHRTLSDLPAEEIEREVRVSKQTLQDMLGRDIGMFSYPRGRYNKHVLQTLKASSYVGARTTRMLAINLDFDRFEMPTSLQVYPHANWTYFRNIAKSRNAGRFLTYLRRFRGTQSWVELGKALFDRVLEEGGIWHVFGHSWEIQERGLWSGLEEILEYVSKREGVLYLPNGEALRLCPGITTALRPTKEFCETQDCSRT